jgi:hypothetical protein
LIADGIIPSSAAVLVKAMPRNAWIAQLRVSGPPPSPNLGVVMGPDFAQPSANLGRNLMEGRLGILTAVFEAAPINT